MSPRTQIKLDPDTRRRAQAKAAEQGISFAEYMRRLVARNLREPTRKRDVSALFDLGASRSPTDVARDKHAMLDETEWEEYTRETSNRRVVRKGASKAKKR